jgi:catechol 2,3-dioxygenase-like lactoylglutathione lyase family enzyme
MPKITGIAHVELSVRDLDATEAWYGRVFDMQTVFSETASENQFGVADRAMFEPESRVVFAFTQQPENAGESFDPRRTGLDHVSFAVADVDELARWRDHLEGLGESPSPFVEWPGGARSFTVADPDGIALEFFVSPRP